MTASINCCVSHCVNQNVMWFGDIELVTVSSKLLMIDGVMKYVQYHMQLKRKDNKPQNKWLPMAPLLVTPAT